MIETPEAPGKDVKNIPDGTIGDDVRTYDALDLGDGFVAKAYSFPDGSAHSQQISSAEEELGTTLAREVLPVDYSPTRWSRSPEMNTRVRTSCRVVARNVAGLRWDLQPIKNESTLTDEEKVLVAIQDDLVRPLLNRPNPFLPLTETLYRCWYDRKATGKGHLEITRRSDGLIDGIYHLQSKNVWPLKRGGWVQKKGRKKRYFKEFRDSTVINAATGKDHDPDKGALNIDDRATEVITFIEYSSDLEVVGAPPHASAATAISGNWYAASRNRNMQITDATPRAMILVQGGALSERSEESIHTFLNAAARNEDDLRSNRIMVLSVQKTTPNSGTNPSIDVVPLTVASNEDATFLKYRSANDDEVREAYGLASLYYGSAEGSNRASAGVARHITIEQAFKPETEELEYRLNHDIISDILAKHGQEAKDIVIQIVMLRPPATDEVEQSQVISRYIQGGGLSPNDIRRYLNRQGFDLPLWVGAWAEMPLFITLAALKIFPEDVGLPLGSADDVNAVRMEGNSVPDDESGDGADDEPDDAGGEDLAASIIRSLKSDISLLGSIPK